MKYTFRQLSYFIAAAETGSITLASRRATIAQQRSDRETAMDDGRQAQTSSATSADEEPRYGLTPLGRALLLAAAGSAEREHGRLQMLRP